MKVLLVTGSYPPDVCGIGHYTYRLAEALENAGADVDVITGRGWGIRRVFQVIRRVGFSRSNLLHIQYPTEGFGWSLAPQALALLRPSVITIHEFSRVHPLRKLAILALFLCGRQLIFTSEHERNVALRIMPRIRQRSAVIEIGSNIPVPANWPPRRLNEIMYFGLVAPNKGIEQVFELAALVAQRGLPLRVRVVGATVPRFRRYADELIEQAKGLPIDLYLDHNDKETGEIIAGASVGYLPFPEGATIGRGSLKALLVCGVAIITTNGRRISSELAEAVLLAADPEEALQSALKLLSDAQQLETISQKAHDYSETFDWTKIALAHLETYRRFLGSTDTVESTQQSSYVIRSEKHSR